MTRGKIHGMSKSAEYRAWSAMKERCGNPNDPGFKNYGGRGIEVCDRWQNSFVLFLNDVGRRATPDLSLERIDNDGDYEPGNVKWASWKEQANNRRSNHLIEINGEVKTLTQWSEHYGIASHSVFARLSRGWNEETALTHRNINPPASIITDGQTLRVIYVRLTKRYVLQQNKPPCGWEAMSYYSNVRKAREAWRRIYYLLKGMNLVK